MVDFEKQLKGKSSPKVTNPVELYETLDRRSDKGPLRPAQHKVVEDWHHNRRSVRDIVLKMHTGQGKTLCGLLMLQSRINQNGQPALYVCANKFLAEQTLRQAAEFGIEAVGVDSEIPSEYQNAKSILVCHVQKLFNGRSKFGLGPQSIEAGSIVIDDAHACTQTIRESCLIDLPRNHAAYKSVVDLFSEDLKEQGRGTFADIKNDEYDAILPVPYWAWEKRIDELTDILANHSSDHEIWFVWPLLRDLLSSCACLVSGTSLQIIPYTLPVDSFGTYWKADTRIFMSATMADDSTLIRDFGVDRKSIEKPLLDHDEGWSGEKMVLLPDEISSELDASRLGATFGRPGSKKRTIGVVVLVPSFKTSIMWENYGSKVVKTGEVDDEVQSLQNGDVQLTRVFVNRYEGIDLPDAACRILILDGMPHAGDLVARYEANVRIGSDVLDRKRARTVEQGMGRSVRGTRDYSVVILNGSDLTKLVRSKKTRNYFSAQTRRQLEIGLEVAEMAKQDIESGASPEDALTGLVRKSLSRDDGWKSYYQTNMSDVVVDAQNPEMLDICEAEARAEQYYQKGKIDQAVKCLQRLLDDGVVGEADRGWYLQTMGRMQFRKSQTSADEYQRAAYGENRYLLKPRHGVQYKAVKAVPERRVERIQSWVADHGDYEELRLDVSSILANLRFGVNAEEFEGALNRLGVALGFDVQRPEKEWKEGPDNLWAIEDGGYVVFEAKSEVRTTRKWIYKAESEQINNSAAWFKKHYPGCKAKNILIVPARKLKRDAAFDEAVWILGSAGLNDVCSRVRAFFDEFSHVDLNNLSSDGVANRLEAHRLRARDFDVPLFVEPIWSAE